MSQIDVILRTLAEQQQSIIGLTEPNYESSPFLINLDTTAKLQIDLKIESQAMSGDTLIWGHPTRGVWGTNKWGSTGSVGFILGSSVYGVLGTSTLGSSASAWETVEELVNV